MSGPTPSAVFGLLRSQVRFHPSVPTSTFEGQTVIVTGANAGLGREAAKLLVALGAARCILAVRTLSKGEEARQYIEAQTGRQCVCEVWQLDMASFSSVKAFAARAMEDLERTDAVVLNAGTWPTKHEVYEGHEATILVNVISTLLLARLLLPAMRKTATTFAGSKPRLTIVTSRLHEFATLKARKEIDIGIFAAFKQLLKPADFDMRYMDSKLLEIAYAQRLAKEIARTNGSCEVFLSLVNPGWCHSGLKPQENFGARTAEKLLARSTDEGASALVDAVALDKVDGRHGQYIDDMQVKEPTAWLRMKDGIKTSERVWNELNEIFEGVVPGATAR